MNTSFRQILKQSRAHRSLQKRIAARRNHAARSSAIKSRLGLAERFTSSSDEIAQFAIDLWPPSPLSRFPTPERREARAVPAKDGLRLNNVRRTEQAWPEPGHPDQRRDHATILPDDATPKPDEIFGKDSRSLMTDRLFRHGDPLRRKHCHVPVRAARK